MPFPFLLVILLSCSEAKHTTPGQLLAPNQTQRQEEVINALELPGHGVVVGNGRQSSEMGAWRGENWEKPGRSRQGALYSLLTR
jgi:hypothetical protein